MNIIYCLSRAILAIALIGGISTSFAAGNLKEARPTSVEFQKSTIYQIHLPIFTQAGTLKSAQKMLSHIANLGFDIVYLCPVVEADDDTNQAFWSSRQKASKTGNPKNPYRIKDYFKIDPQYGNDDDLKDFVNEAHKLGLKVILDLVYYHCGPKAVFIKDNPDFVVRDSKGNVKNGRWHFPELNFKNPQLREMLWKNMEYFVAKFDIDGYRTDVEPAVPADFWAEGYKRISKIKPNIIMIAEGERPDAQTDAYDLNYSFSWQTVIAKVFDSKAPACDIVKLWQDQKNKFVKGARIMRALDNHDTASDSIDARFEKRWSSRGYDAVLALNFTIDGVPMIYNGNDISDTSNLCMFSNRFHGKYCIDWSNALTADGKSRINFLQSLNSMRKSNEALNFGETNWLENSMPKKVLTFARNYKSQNIVVVINTSAKPLTVNIPTVREIKKVLMSHYAVAQCNANGMKTQLEAYGFLIAQY